jgi:hypothetical protein
MVDPGPRGSDEPVAVLRLERAEIPKFPEHVVEEREQRRRRS